MRKHWREELRMYVKSNRGSYLQDPMRNSSHPAGSRSHVSCPALSGALLRHPVLTEPCTSRSSYFPCTCLPLSAVISLALELPGLPGGSWSVSPRLGSTWPQLITVGVLGPVNSSTLTCPTNFCLLHPSLACWCLPSDHTITCLW